MFKSIANNHTKPLQPFHPFPTIKERNFWDHLPQTVQSALNNISEETLATAYPILSLSDFMAYCETGNRVTYESFYFKRRLLVNTAIIIECYENKGRFIHKIIDGIYALCEETAWQLPAHNSYIRGESSYLLPDPTRPVLDLFACETGALLATADYLLGSVLDAVSPYIRKRIHDTLTQRIIQPYLHQHFWWMGADGEPMNNWTIWCTQNILLTFFLTPQETRERLAAFKKANASVDYFLTAYGEDGCCDEGVQYYRHAGLCLMNTIEVFNALTDQAYQPVYKTPIIQNICSYLYYAHVQGPYYINFSDCAAKPGPSHIREYLFAKRTGHMAMMDDVAMDVQKNMDPLLSEEINLFYRIQQLVHYETVLQHKVHPLTLPADRYYASVGLMIVRDGCYTLAVKAGDNDDSHNHNDTGSITVYKNGHPILVDIGVESYTAKTFSPNRYEIWTMQSQYHNLPTLNGYLQNAGPDYRATHVTYALDPKAPFMAMHLESAYPAMDNLKTYQRRVTLLKGSSIHMADTLEVYETKNPFLATLNLITYEPPMVQGHTINLNHFATITVTGTLTLIETECLPITDPRLQLSWDRDLYRIQIHFQPGTLGLDIH